MSESESAEAIEQVRRGMGNFLKSNVERIERIRHPAEGCHDHKKED